MLILFVCSGLRAQVKVLEVNERNGGQTYFLLAESPTIACKRGILTVVSVEKSIELPLAQIKNYRLSDVHAGITNVSDDKRDLSLTTDKIILSGLPANSVVEVITIDGKPVKSVCAKDSKAEIQTSNWTSGVYLIKTSTLTYKIKK